MKRKSWADGLAGENFAHSSEPVAMIKRETARGEILDRPPIRIRQTVQEPPHPENPWLNTFISGDKGALAGWRSILQLGVDPHELETLLLELRTPQAPPAGMRQLSAKDCSRAVGRIERAAEDIGRFSIEFSDVLPGPLPLTDIDYTVEMAQKAEAGIFDSIFLADVLGLWNDVQTTLKKQQNEKRVRFPDRVHTIAAEIVHLCSVASSLAELGGEKLMRRVAPDPGIAVTVKELKKWPGPAQFLYEEVASLCNAVLQAEGSCRALDARNLRRAYNSLHPPLFPPQRQNEKCGGGAWNARRFNPARFFPSSCAISPETSGCAARSSRRFRPRKWWISWQRNMDCRCISRPSASSTLRRSCSSATFLSAGRKAAVSPSAVTQNRPTKITSGILTPA